MVDILKVRCSRLLFLFSFTCLFLFFNCTSQAQLTDDNCVTTAIYQPGVGWIPNSEITLCSPSLINITDGSSYASSILNECGVGNSCPTGPIEGDNGITAEIVCELEQSLEFTTDILAHQVANEIAVLDPSLEHGALIVSTASGPMRLRIVTGVSGTINTGELNSTLAEAGISRGAVIGLLHSHPQEESSQLNDRNRAPSHDGNNPPVAGDYAYSGYLRDIAVAFFGASEIAFNSAFTHYIVGPDGILREFDGANPHPSLDGDNQIDDAEALAAEIDANGDCPHDT